MLNKPLEGVKVVDLTYFVAGPGTAKILADWGADVIKVEPSFGDPGRKTGATMLMPIEDDVNPFYTTYNANKRGFSVNLKCEQGLQIMDQLLSKANVFVSSYRTGALKRLGLDYEALAERHPHLIWAQVNGFGDYGPAKDSPGFDTVAFWARSGTMLDIAEKDTSPINPPIGFGDATTSCSLAGGICAALYHQAKTGKGQKVMVSLFGQAIWNASSLIASTQYGDEYPKTRKDAVSPVINSFRCSDGKWIFLSILEYERYFPTLCEVLERKDLIQDERFATTLSGKNNAPALIAEIDKEFAKHTQEEMVRLLSSADIAHEKIQHYSEIISDAQALENNYVVEDTNRDGSKTTYAMTPIKFGNIEVNLSRTSPLIGEHSEEIMSEIGYSENDILKFIKDGVIAVSK
ncbi:CoA transferase [Sinanaerobacter sp. ZZT-01]|uniref:CaiB/BaiF CoA transferase family protein n=1 Tax=Sinanaerobacter sp. ZZT-01 TaxID=3111540 RepID=UPI002D774E67|nr:CoA transferase [Sinanaerobacter sp. ZZT-01]WRR93268.1 CoA transferase [Sinanaerobacter sp. ZZT-01]